MVALSRAGAGHLAMLAFSLLVSMSFTLGHIVAGEIAPATLTAIRFAIASVVLLGALIALRVPVRPAFTGFWRWVIIGALMAFYFITMFEALRITTAVSTAAVFTLTPLLAAGLSFVMIRQRTGFWTFLALAIGAIGALWVIFRADLSAFLRLEIGAGEALFTFGAAAHALVPVLLRRLSRGELPLQTSFASILGALVVTMLYALPELRVTDFPNLPPAVWLVSLYLGIVTTAGTFFLLQYAALRLPPGKVMAYTYLVPSWVVLWDLFLGRTQPLLLLGGIGLTLIALLMLLRDEET